MYPPIFRDRKRAALNLASLDEVASLLRRGGFFVGIAPRGHAQEGRRPVHVPAGAERRGARHPQGAQCPVVPVFVNGLLNDLVEQVRGGAHSATATPIHVVFGEPIDFGGLLDAPESPRTYKRISEKCLERIGELGQEEKAFRDVPLASSPTTLTDVAR